MPKANKHTQVFEIVFLTPFAIFIYVLLAMSKIMGVTGDL